MQQELISSMVKKNEGLAVAKRSPEQYDPKNYLYCYHMTNYNQLTFEQKKDYGIYKYEHATIVDC